MATPLPGTTSRSAMLLIAAVIAAGSLAGCGFGTKVDSALGLVEEAIIDLREGSAEWQQVLRDLQADVAATAQTTISTEVDNLVQRAIAGAQVSAFCTVDFLRDRARQSLQQLVDRLRERKPQPLPPKVCKAIPTSINGHLDPSRRYQIDVMGYDLDSLTSDQKLKLFLIEEGKSPRDVTAQGLSLVTHYEATINLGSTGVPISERSRKLELRHPGMTTSNITIIHPLPPPPESMLVRLGTDGWAPPRKPGSGDREFKGHGPCVTAKAEIRSGGDHIEHRLFMLAYECNSNLGRQSDFSRAEGWSEWKPSRLLDPPGTKIVRILSPTSSLRPKYRDTKHSEDIRQMGLGDLVHTYKTWGDTGGDDVEAGTRLQVLFNPVKVLAQKPAPKTFLNASAFTALKTEQLRKLGATFRPRSMVIQQVAPQ